MAKRRTGEVKTTPPSEEAITVNSPEFGKITPPEGHVESLTYEQLLDALLLPKVHPLEMGLYQAWKGVMLREYAAAQYKQEEKETGG
jgi:hypothetical protein